MSYLEISAESLPRSVLELRKLPVAGVDDGLDALLGLFADGNRPVQPLIGEQAHKHLRKTGTGSESRRDEEGTCISR